MARLSDAETALQQIEDVYDKIDDLYQAVQYIKTIRKKTEESIDSIREYETQLQKRLEDFKAAERAYEAASKRMEEFGKKAEENIQHIISQFDQEKKKIDDTLLSMLAERKEIEGLHRSMEDQIARIHQDAASQSETLKSKLETAASESRGLIEKSIQDYQTIINTDLNRFSSSADAAKKDLAELTIGIERFKSQIELDIVEKTNHLMKQQSDGMDSLTRKAEAAFTSITEQISQIASQTMTSIAEELKREKERIQESLDFLQSERKDIHQLHDTLTLELSKIGQNFTLQMTGFSEQLQLVIQEAQAQVQYFLKTGKAELVKKTSESSNQINFLEEELKQKLSDVENDIRLRMDQQFQEGRYEVENRLSEWSETLDNLEAASRTKIDQAVIDAKLQLDALSCEGSEKIRILENECRQQISHNLLESKQEVMQMAELLKVMKEETSQQISQLILHGKTEADSRSQEWESFLGESKTTIQNLENNFVTFQERIREDSDRSSSAIINQFQEVQNKLHQDVQTQFSEIAEQWQVTLAKKLESELTSLSQEIQSEKQVLHDSVQADRNLIRSDLQNLTETLTDEIRSVLKEETEKMTPLINDFQENQQAIQGMRTEISSYFEAAKVQLGDKTKEYAAFLKKMAALSHLKIGQIISKSNSMLEDHEAQLSEFMRESSRQMDALKLDIQAFQNTIRSNLEHDVNEKIVSYETLMNDKIQTHDRQAVESIERMQRHAEETISGAVSELNASFISVRQDLDGKLQELLSRQTAFQNELTDQIASKLSQEAETIAPQLQENIINALKDGLIQIKDASEAAVRQDRLEQTLSEMMAEFREEQKNRKKIDAAFTNLIKKLAISQNEQRNSLPDLEKRLQALEANLTIMNPDLLNGGDNE